MSCEFAGQSARGVDPATGPGAVGQAGSAPSSARPADGSSPYLDAIVEFAFLEERDAGGPYSLTLWWDSTTPLGGVDSSLIRFSNSPLCVSENTPSRGFDE